MPKTAFADTPPTGTVVSAAFLNALNNQRHTGRNIDGDGALDYAISTGSANAYAVTLSPALDAHIAGMPIRFKANFTNTGAATLNINGLGEVALKKNVNIALAAGDILSGQVYTVIYDGTNYQLSGGLYVAAPDFLSSLGNSGYQKLPSGLLLQWGTFTSSSSADVTVTFPITFSAAAYHAWVGGNYAPGTGVIAYSSIGIISLSQATIRSSFSSQLERYFVIGQ